MRTKVTDMDKDSFYAQRIALLFDSSFVPICFPWISENRKIKLFWESAIFCTGVEKNVFFWEYENF